MTTLPLRIGIVGANPDRGWGSGVHRRVVAMSPDLALTAVATTRADTAAAAADAFGAAHWFTDGGDLARCADVDLVAVCVLAPYHYGIARAAIEAGKHVYCEWPLALTAEQAEELARLARERGVKAMIGLHLNGAPVMRHAAALIAQGFIGKVIGVNAHVRVPGPITRTMAMRANGTTLTSIYGGHLIDAIDRWFGAVGDFDARARIHLPPFDETGSPVDRDAADHLLVHGELAGGALFSLDLGGASMGALGSCWRIEGTEGQIVLSSADPAMPAMEALVLHAARTGEALRPMPLPADCDCGFIPPEPARYHAYPGVEASRAALCAVGNLYTDLARAIRRDLPVTPDFARAARVQHLVGTIDDRARSTLRHPAAQETLP